MRHVKAISALLAVAVVAVVGYGTLDAYDKVPGVLTLSPSAPGPTTRVTTAPKEPEAPSTPSTPPVRIAPASAPKPPLPQLALDAPAPTRKGLVASLAKPLANQHLGNSLGLTVRDASTGRHLLDIGAAEPRTPASTTKLLTAAAVSSALDLPGHFTTKAVQGSSPRDVVLVAGGDSLLSPGRGDHSKTSGYAGLDELAAQVKASLAKQGGAAKKGAKATNAAPIRVTVDDSYADGPLRAPGWSQTVINLGFVGPVAMLGLSTQRAVAGHPGSHDPVMSTAGAFRDALARQGLTVSATVEHGTAPKAARTIGAVRSAPIGDVLALALDQSDNALTEQLARIAAVHQGVRPDFAPVAAWVERTVKDLGVDIKGVHLADSCGLSDGTRIPARVIGDVLTLATTGHDPALQGVLSQLPVAGLSGTLYDRFLEPGSRSVDGLARAKTGSLPGVSALAGTVVDRDGRMLVFVLLADNVRPVHKKGDKSGDHRPGSPGVSKNAWVATKQVHEALDAVVVRLGDCGCRG